MLATVPCIHIPNPGDRNPGHKAWTCPVPGTTHWLIIRQVVYQGKVIGIRVVKLVP